MYGKKLYSFDVIVHQDYFVRKNIKITNQFEIIQSFT